MTDGLYRVLTPNLCAGFVLQNDRVVRSAPILRKRLAKDLPYWVSVAQWLGP